MHILQNCTVEKRCSTLTSPEQYMFEFVFEFELFCLPSCAAYLQWSYRVFDWNRARVVQLASFIFAHRQQYYTQHNMCNVYVYKCDKSKPFVSKCLWARQIFRFAMVLPLNNQSAPCMHLYECECLCFCALILHTHISFGIVSELEMHRTARHSDNTKLLKPAKCTRENEKNGCLPSGNEPPSKQARKRK